MLLYLPQFFGPPPVRIAHGVLLAVGCLWLAGGLWSRRAAGPPLSADDRQRTISTSRTQPL